ncbi:MAG: hypothetical protein ABI305_08185 [Tepidiformaceae bacterium]
MNSLLGTTAGNVVFNPSESPPPAKSAPDGWSLDLGLPSWSSLDNGNPSLQIVMQVRALPGAALELWLRSDDTGKTVARWTGGATSAYQGAICFQLGLADKTTGTAAPIPDGKYHLTMAFRDPNTGVVVSEDSEVAGTTPKLEGKVPTAGSDVFWTALACRQGN